ncbi:MAG: DUF4347 domain-containing protein, partial [Planctomycetota bacterium]
MSKKRSRPDNRRALIEELERRILLSADFESALLDPSIADGLDPHDPAAQAELLQQTETGSYDAAVVRRELVLVDAGVEDHQDLLADLRSADSHGRQLEVVLLDGERDGIAQISEILEGREDLDAVHFVSHGTEGAVQLGTTWLTRESIDSHQSAIASWGDALSDKADLLFYGCDLAGGESGAAFVESLSYLTGADVAASTDATGSAILGGDWELEYATGGIESPLAPSASFQTSWQAVLAAAVDAASSGSTVGQASVTVSHTTSGTNRLMLVGVATDPHGESVSSITYNGVDLSLVGSQEVAGAHSRVEIWSLVAPDTGTHDVVVNVTGTGHHGLAVGVMTFTGVNQTNPLLGFSSASGDSTTASTTVASAADDLVFGVVHSHGGTEATPDAGQTEYWDIVADKTNSSGTIAAGAASVTTSWTVKSADWSVAAVSVQADTNFAQKATWSPVQDAYIQLKNPDTNAGTLGSMVVDRESSDLQRTLLQFDLSSIPAAATIQSATLKLESTAIDGLLNIDVHQMLESWVEGSATWNESSSGTNWSTPGGAFDPTALDSITTDSTGQHRWDLTALVQDWVNGAEQNHGVLVGSHDTGGNRTVTYDSREGAVPPILEIIYGEVNDAPVNTVPGPQSILQDTSLIFSSGSGNAISISDVDAGFNDIQVTLTA